MTGRRLVRATWYNIALSGDPINRLGSLIDNVYVRLTRTIVLVIASAVLHGCASAPKLMPTPNFYALGKSYPVETIKNEHRNNRVDVLYVTDRSPEMSKNGLTEYSAARSSSMAFGIAEVAIGNNLPWNDLVEVSSSSKKIENLTYTVQSRREFGRFPSTPYPFQKVAGVAKLRPKVQSAIDQSTSGLRKLVVEKIQKTAKKDLVLYIHGYNNSFDKAAFTLAGIWHFIGRQGVPMVYSWPAAHGGLRGYFVDRESGEYSIYHLKETLRILFDTPEIENIHIIAHSRGTDIMTTALRELILENRINGRISDEKLRVKNLILAAPDLDFGVISQRLMAERFGLAIGQITIYTTQSDKALGFAQRLMSGVRFGRVKSTDLTDDQRTIFASAGNVSIVQVNQTKGFVGHGYFHSSPAVSSDVISILTTNAKPGSKARPLIYVNDNFWVIPSGYPAPQ